MRRRRPPDPPALGDRRDRVAWDDVGAQSDDGTQGRGRLRIISRPTCPVCAPATRSSSSTVGRPATSSSTACWSTSPTSISSSVAGGSPEPFAIQVAKEAGEPLGAEVSSAVFDRVRTCDNHCEFCFIHQLPKGMRRSLSLKDDDYRLSFLYGNFTTLTRFTEMDLERVLTERLSPLFVSIHATDPEIRADLLRNRRGATSLRWLQALLDGGIEVHGQVVVCPGRNDGDDPRRHPGRRARPLPEPGHRGLRAPRGEPLLPRGGHAAPHHRRGGRGVRRGRAVAGHVPGRHRAGGWCSRPTSTT